jgi:hypothetical protein
MILNLGKVFCINTILNVGQNFYHQFAVRFIGAATKRHEQYKQHYQTYHFFQ